MMEVKVIAIIVTFNRKCILVECIKALNKSKIKPYKIIIVDNCSQDNTENELKQHYSHLFDEYLLLDENYGYGGGLAEGMKFSLQKFPDYDGFWLMDDDSMPNDTHLMNIITHTRSFDLHVIGSTGFSISKGIPRERFSDSLEDLKTVDFILIDGAYISKSVVEAVGLIRSDLFQVAAEDFDYCWRIRNAGFRIVIANFGYKRLTVGHKNIKSQIWRGYYHARNHYIIVKEHGNAIDLFWYFIRQLKYLLAGFQLPFPFQRFYFRFKGIVHGIKNKRGKTLDPSNLKWLKVKQ